jgi:signal transduction histidine kinase
MRTLNRQGIIKARWFLLPTLLLGTFCLADDVVDLAISDSERAWLAQHPVILHGVVDQAREHEPFEYYDDHGRYRGLTSDYFQILAEQLGLKFIEIKKQSLPAIGAALDSGEIDIASYLPLVDSRRIDREYSEPIIRMPIVLLGRVDAPLITSLFSIGSEIIAVEKYSYADRILQINHPDINIKYVDSTQDGLRALQKAEVDVFIHNAFSAEFFQRKMGLSPFKIVNTTPYTFDIHFTVNKNLAPLIPILQKVMAGLSEREERLLFDKWINIQVERQLDWRTVIFWGGLCLLVVLVVIGGILIWNRHLASEVAVRTVELENSSNELRDLARHMTRVREDEKSMLAREIHDELGHTLTALSMGMRRLEGLFKSGSMEQNVFAAEESGQAIGVPIENKFRELINLVKEASRTSRKIMSDLRPGVLEDLGLTAALEWLVHEFQTQCDIECTLFADDISAGISDDAATALFRIVQESLTNIAKHADATHITVSLKRETAAIVLCIVDDGKGLSRNWETKEGSFGLKGMRERTLALGGELHVEPAEDGGVSLRLQVPI